MTDLVYDYITMGVDMMISAAMLTAIVILLRGSTILSQYSAAQQMNTDRINYYKQYNMYDMTEGLTAADAKSALSYYRHTMTVYVWLNSTDSDYGKKCIMNDPKTGKYYYIDIDKNVQTEITYDDISNYIQSTMLFKCKLAEDNQSKAFNDNSTYKGGVITTIIFY